MMVHYFSFQNLQYPLRQCLCFTHKLEIVYGTHPCIFFIAEVMNMKIRIPKLTVCEPHLPFRENGKEHFSFQP